eukprot:scaffold177801_cov35-Prasinocladus_malaysianus.AAC.1
MTVRKAKATSESREAEARKELAQMRGLEGTAKPGEVSQLRADKQRLERELNQAKVETPPKDNAVDVCSCKSENGASLQTMSMNVSGDGQCWTYGWIDRGLDQWEDGWMFKDTVDRQIDR